MAKTRAGDFRNLDRVRAWAREIAHAVPAARPRPAVAQAGHSMGALLAHGALGWAVCAAIMAVLLHVAAIGVALAVHAIAAPIVFAVVARHYFRRRGAREPMPVAATFAIETALLDAAIVAGLVLRDTAMLRSVGGFRLPLALVFLVTWAVGAIVSIGPSPSAASARR